MRIRLLRHATVVVTLHGMRLLVDPMLSPAEGMEPVPQAASARRIPLVDLPVDQAALDHLIRKLDALLITHLHRDHFDARAAELLPRGLPVLCQPTDAARLTELGFTDVLPVEAERTWRGLRIARTGGRHGSGEVGERMGAVSGFVLEAPSEPRLYLVGDTIWCDEVEAALRRHRPDVVVVNAGAAQFLTGGPITMTAEDVIRVCRAAPQARVIAVHLEALNHCLLTRAALEAALADVGVLGQAQIPDDGDVVPFVR
jgi:L-ascorbate metabolism protein UlaG (beta-lactamase superfamily)